MAIVFSGHRPRRLGADQNRIDDFCLEILPYHMLSFDEPAWTGMALGFDQGAALSCMLAGRNYTAAIPYRGYETMWNADQCKSFEILVQSATKSVIVCEGGFHVSKLFARNRWMIDMARVYKSPRLICLFDGVEKGGTWDTIQQAEAWDFEVVNLWGEWERFKKG